MSKHLLASVILCLLTHAGGFAQSSSAGPALTPAGIWDSLVNIERIPVNRMSEQEKLPLVLGLRQEFEKRNYPEDSVYARLLHRIALYQYHTTRDYRRCVENTLHAIRINTSGKKGACLLFAVNSYKNLGFYYKDLLFFDLALRSFDSAILLATRFPGQDKPIEGCRQEKSKIFFAKGDYGKSIEEATLGIRIAEQIHDTLYHGIFLQLRASARTYLGLYAAASIDADVEEKLALLIRDTVTLARSLNAKAQIDKFMGNYDRALEEYRHAIRLAASGEPTTLTDYNIDQGNMLMDNMGRLAEAERCYTTALRLAKQAQYPDGVISAYIDLNVLCHNRQDYSRAILNLHQALKQLKIPIIDDPFQNPSFSVLAPIQDKKWLLVIFSNKTDDLLQLFRRTHRSECLQACLRTALLSDSINTALRHEQTDDPSKLVWRKKTREFFANALDACWLAQDMKLAFFFMEKSRAVLLNDRLNELGAAAFLAPQDAARQQQLQLALIGEEQQLAALPDSAPAFRLQQVRFIQAKDSLERYTRSLEEKAPAYYRYKFADAVPSLDSLQGLLAQEDRHFVHYFVTDSSIYLLGITAKNVRLMKVPYRGFRQEVDNYLRLCIDRQVQNADYPGFARLSYTLYQQLLEPLHWDKGRVLICPDDFFIPFEALTADTIGRHFLIELFTFDYVYSARYFMYPVLPSEGEGNFLGIAPALFHPGLKVPDLPQSILACRQAAGYYTGAHLLMERAASRQSFLQKATRYSVMNVYTHARSNGGDEEPLLYLSDSAIRLSELPLLQRPATQLIVLSACQTNTGKAAEGEGVYSLARGFAAAGIPAVAATLWQADEQSIYAITADFHHRLAQGMDKDQALRESKLEYIRSGSASRSLPYYWANMILIGNTRPLALAPPHQAAWWPELALLALTALLLAWKLRRREQGRP